MKDGKYKDIENDLAEQVIDNLLLSGYINTENVKSIPLTQIYRKVSDISEDNATIAPSMSG